MSELDPTATGYAAPPFSAETAPISYPRPPTDEQYLDDDDEEWVTQAPTGVRVPALIGLLAVLFFAVCGFWGGAVLQRHHDNKTTNTRVAAALATAIAGRRSAAGAGAAAGGFGGFGGGSGGGAGTGGRTAGTVTDVEGTTVFVTDASGAVVKVNLAPTTTITKTTAGTAADLQLGQTVVVAGTKAADGTTTASAITISGSALGAGGAPGSTGGTGGSGG